MCVCIVRHVLRDSNLNKCRRVLACCSSLWNDLSSNALYTQLYIHIAFSEDATEPYTGTVSSSVQKVEVDHVGEVASQ